MTKPEVLMPESDNARLLHARYGAAAAPGVADAGRKARLAQPVVAFRERYAPRDEAELIARYDATLAEFSRAQGLGAVSWTGRVLARMGSLKGPNGRERMRSMLRSLGFELR